MINHKSLSQLFPFVCVSPFFFLSIYFWASSHLFLLFKKKRKEKGLFRMRLNTYYFNWSSYEIAFLLQSQENISSDVLPNQLYGNNKQMMCSNILRVP